MPRASQRLMTGPQLDRVGAMNDQSLTLPDEGALLSLYYDGARLPSPSGGFLIVLGVQAEDDGTGSVLLECMSSSLRYEVTVPKGTRSERKKVRDKMASGADPKCPRHQGNFWPEYATTSRV